MMERIKRTERFRHLYQNRIPTEITVRFADGSAMVYDRRVQQPGYVPMHTGNVVVGYRWKGRS